MIGNVMFYKLRTLGTEQGSACFETSLPMEVGLFGKCEIDNQGGGKLENVDSWQR